MAKTDGEKALGDLYNKTRKDPFVVDVPAMNFLMIDGEGDPNVSKAFREAVETLYGVSYGAKFVIKKREAARDYKVSALEGLWWSKGAAGFDWGKRAEWLAKRDEWLWTAMIMQPAAVAAKVVEDASEALRKKGKGPALAKMRFESFHEGLSVQMLHIGPYAEEPATVAKMMEFARSEGYELTGKHHEIYMGDPRRSAPEKLKTILRHPVRKA